jgi:hypothetical protein
MGQLQRQFSGVVGDEEASAENLKIQAWHTMFREHPIQLVRRSSTRWTEAKEPEVNDVGG